VATLTLTYGTMAAGKSTLALQLHWQLCHSGRTVELWTFGDRSSEPEVTSRIGIHAAARSQPPSFDTDHELRRLLDGEVEVIVVDEVQFATTEQIDWLASLVDNYGIDVHTFGLGADFLLNPFPGTARLFAIADAVDELPLVTYCWCGARGRCNARIVNGVVQRAGAQKVIGNTTADADVFYQVLCRSHYIKGLLGPE
jgi:thymidine kinase